MKKYFYLGALFLLVFEVLNVYWIMPMPGSQETNSLGLAYFLCSWRWPFRLVFVTFILIGLKAVFTVGHKWLPVLILLLTVVVVWMFNFKMVADKMFLQVKHLSYASKKTNKLPGERLVIGVEYKGQARAYPIEFLAYHHQVRDSIGGRPVMVTYCSVCHTGRVFVPIVKGHYENFRLVGMDHFNAMFEDESTGSWWRQATGEAVAGKLKGSALPEMSSHQMSLDQWFELYPDGEVMQADENFLSVYDPEAKYEQGKNKGTLTRTDSLPWKMKSWVLGVKIGKYSKAYDWRDLEKMKIINDSLANTNIVLVLASDGKSFAAFERPAGKIFTLRNDTLISGAESYDLLGRNTLDPGDKLYRINVYQEFWHSWKTFQPNTLPYLTRN